jgi:hypothetical protein
MKSPGQERVGSVLKTGRNDPCPCGSGKKYKKCCMPTNVASPAELHYRRLSEIYDRVFETLSAHAQRVLWRDGGRPALNAYFLLDSGEEPEEEIHERQMGLFLPWMLFNWHPRSGLQPPERWRTIAEIYLEEKRHLLEELDRRLIEAVEMSRTISVSTGTPYGVESGVRGLGTGSLHILRAPGEGWETGPRDQAGQARP